MSYSIDQCDSASRTKSTTTVDLIVAIYSANIEWHSNPSQSDGKYLEPYVFKLLADSPMCTIRSGKINRVAK
ncbi:hypothetical protein CLF_105218 [Clonorchis sinensis]|uniref:Uncharacterized protein n=1 Tax=Clonorchis sinensis TaxID=79923 RepID=G7YD80_CLOSI|nr:hypothetical protein CLF_105218 [Clonorchis sinensis]